MPDTATLTMPLVTGIAAPPGNGAKPEAEPLPELEMEHDARLRIAVIFGGRSAEREVSLSSGRQVFYHLDATRFEAIPVFMDVGGGLWRLPEKLVIQNTCADVEARLATEGVRLGIEELTELADLAFIALHGKYGDDGCIQGALELIGVPYTGSGVLACAFSLDKPMAHSLLAAGGYDTPREIVVHEEDFDPNELAVRVAEEFGFPCVVLPAREGSSLGVTVVADPAGLAPALAEAFRYDRRAVVEEHLDGLEFSVIVIGNDEPHALLPTEIVTANPFMTYDDKYMPGRSQKITPARVEPATLEAIRTTSENVYKWLGFRGYARLDGFLTTDQRIVFSDPNSTCGMAPSSFLFHQAAEEGLGPTELITRLVELALEAHKAKKGPLG